MFHVKHRRGTFFIPFNAQLYFVLSWLLLFLIILYAFLLTKNISSFLLKDKSRYLSLQVIVIKILYCLNKCLLKLSLFIFAFSYSV